MRPGLVAMAAVWAHLSSTTTKTRNARWNAAFTRQDRQNSEYLPPKGGVPVVLPRCARRSSYQGFELDSHLRGL